MPTFEFTSPDGKTFQVDGPDGATKEQAFAMLQSHLQSQPKPTVVSDVGQGALAGFSHDLSSVIDPALKLATPAYNMIEGAFNSLKAPSDQAATLPNQQALPQAVSSATGGTYQPQTPPGQLAQTIAENAPNALFPGGAGARVARVLASAIPSELAGQATKGTKYEGAARLAASLGGTLGQGAVEGFLNRTPGTPAPSLDDLNQMKDATYKAADNAGVVIKPGVFQKFSIDLGDDLTKNNVVQSDIHKNALSALSVIQQEASSGVPLTLSRADAIRQAVGNAAEQASAPGSNGGDARLVGKIKGAFDGFLDGLTPSDVISGDPQTAVPILKSARDLAQRSFKATEIQKLIDLAQNSASTNYSASGEEQALRVQFKNLNAQLIKDPTAAAAFTDDERAAIQKVAQGGPVVNGLRWLGKLAPTNVISGGAATGGGAALGSAVGGPVGAAIGAAALPALGGAARLGANAITGKNAEMAAALMRAGPNAASVAPGVTSLPPDILRKLLVSGMLSQSGPPAAQ